MNKRNRRIDEIYSRYEYLAEKYADKLFNINGISYEREDLLQDFREKLFKSILSYIRNFDKYLKGLRSRPTPMKIYLQTVMSNYYTDSIKKINSQKYGGWDRYVSVERNSFDYSSGVDMDMSTIEDILQFKISKKLEDYVVIINGVDLLEGLSKVVYKRAFIMFLLGYKFATIDLLLKINSKQIVKKQVDYLKTKKEQLMDFKHYQNFVYDTSEDD